MLTRTAGAQAGHPTSGRDTPSPPMDAIVRGLTPPHRQIIVATYFRRQTTEQAARWLGITPAEAKARLYYAVQELAAITRSSVVR